MAMEFDEIAFDELLLAGCTVIDKVYRIFLEKNLQSWMRLVGKSCQPCGSSTLPASTRLVSSPTLGPTLN